MGMNLKQRLGLRVKASRERAGLTQEQLATQIGRTPESVSNLERGQTLPSLTTLELIGRCLDTPLRDFLDDDPGARELGRKRLELEIRAKALIRSLADEDLEIAVKQIEALANRGGI